MRSSTRAVLIGGGVTCLLSTATPVFARDWPSAGGWDVIEASETCGIMQSYEGKGDTELIFGLPVAGGAFVQLTNTGWSAKVDQEYEVAWLVNGNSYSGSSVGVGKEYDVRKGFSAKFSDNFIADFSKGTTLSLFLGEMMIDKLSLNGSSAALVIARKCLAAVRADLAAVAREKARFAHIPDDPFAGVAGRRQSQPLSPATVASWISNDDYPPSSRRAGEEGAVGVRLHIGELGRLERCEIVRSSGFAVLDETTCRLILRRGRAPLSVGQTVDHTVRWALTE